MKTVTFLLLLLIVGGCASPAPDRRSGTVVQPTPVPTVAAPARPTYTVQRGEVVSQMEFSARIAPVVEQLLVFAVPGQVKTVYAQRDQQVQAGDLLAELDTEPHEAELFQAQAVLDIARTRLETVQKEMAIERRRAEIRVDLAELDLSFARQQAGALPTPEQAHQIARLALQLELAQLELAQLADTVDPVLQADVDAAQLRVLALEGQLEQARLPAPFAGQLLSLTIAPGRNVAAQETVGIIADPRQLEVSANLNANQLRELVEDLPVVITAANRPGDSYSGFIRQLPYLTGGAATNDSGVRIGFEDAPTTFQLGDRVVVRVVLDRHADVLWLPPVAIRDFNGRKFVVIEEGDFQRRVDITPGLTSAERVEIISGVNEGDVVVGQ